jgi:hypothetical protein
MLPNQPALYQQGMGQMMPQTLAQGPPQPPGITPGFSNRMSPNVMNKVMGGSQPGGGRPQGMPNPPPPNLIKQSQEGSVGGGGVEPQQILDMYELVGNYMGSGDEGLNLDQQWGAGGGPEGGGGGDMFNAPGGMTGMGLGMAGGYLSSEGQGGSMFGGWFDGDKADTGETWAGIGGGAMQGYAWGGPWGALVGGILGAVGAWT